MSDWPEDTIEATLSTETDFCLDFWHEPGCQSHFDDVSPGDTVQCNDDVTACSARWVLGNTIRLVPIPFAGMVPSCTHVAEPADRDPVNRQPDTGADEVNNDLDKLLTWAEQFRANDPPHASCQWKGTEASYTFTCNCGAACKIDSRWFAYLVMCPECRVVYHCVDDIPIERVTLDPGALTGEGE